MQAVLILPKFTRKDEQSLANKLVVAINKKYGDLKFTGVVHPFRLAGFCNKKPGKGNPTTTLLRAESVICQQSLIELNAFRNAVKVPEEKVLVSHGARRAAGGTFGPRDGAAHPSQ